MAKRDEERGAAKFWQKAYTNTTTAKIAVATKLFARLAKENDEDYEEGQDESIPDEWPQTIPSHKRQHKVNRQNPNQKRSDGTHNHAAPRDSDIGRNQL